MSTRPDPERSGAVEIATWTRPRLRVVWDLRELTQIQKPRLWSLPTRLDPVYPPYPLGHWSSLCLHLRPVRAWEITGGNQGCFIQRACDALQIGRPQVLNRRLHHDFEVLQWSKLDGLWGTQNQTTNNPRLNVCASRADSYDTASRKHLQPAKLRDAPDGVCEGVGCARQQSVAARNDSRGVFVNLKVRLSSTKISHNRKSIPFHARVTLKLRPSSKKNLPQSQKYPFSREGAY